MTDSLDQPLHDSELMAEIELTSDLMIAAAQSDGPVEQEEIDALLQVRSR
jgi:uncharacterized membrane protein YebE (DUF533 family)